MNIKLKKLDRTCAYAHNIYNCNEGKSIRLLVFRELLNGGKKRPYPEKYIPELPV